MNKKTDEQTLKDMQHFNMILNDYFHTSKFLLDL